MQVSGTHKNNAMINHVDADSFNYHTAWVFVAFLKGFNDLVFHQITSDFAGRL